jgi:hypothetical protein
VSFKAQCGVVKAKIGINHVTEISSPALYRILASISVSPATARVSASLRTATANLKLAANQAATVRFVNSKLVVQVPTLPTTPPGSPPTFSVNGGTSFRVQGGACSTPDRGPGRNGDGFGSHREEPLPRQHLDGQLKRPIWRAAPDRRRADPNAVPVNPASVTVPYGDVGNETVVTSLNVVDPTQFKICKQETSSDAMLAGSTFNFGWSYGSIELRPAPCP